MAPPEISHFPSHQGMETQPITFRIPHPRETAGRGRRGSKSRTTPLHYTVRRVSRDTSRNLMGEMPPIRINVEESSSGPPIGGPRMAASFQIPRVQRRVSFRGPMTDNNPIPEAQMDNGETPTPAVTEIRYEKRYDRVFLNQTNFWISGNVFFVSRFLHPLTRLIIVPNAMEAPAVFVLAFMVPTLGLLTMTQERKLRLLLLVGILDFVHWILATLPVHYAGYWEFTDSIWAYPLNLVAVGHILTTVVFVLAYGRNIAAERYAPGISARVQYTPTQHTSSENDFDNDSSYASRSEGRHVRLERENQSSRKSGGGNSQYHRSTSRDRDRQYSSSYLPRGKPSDEESSDRDHLFRGKPPDEEAPQTEAQRIIQQLREELLSIGSIQKRKARLRELQKQFHPDKNPPSEEEKVREVFLYVQNWWDDIDGNFVAEYKTHVQE